MQNTTTKIEISKLDLESLESSLDNVIHLKISNTVLINSLVFAYESTGNVQYLNDIIRLEDNKEVA